VIAGFATLDDDTGLVFKGGTALRLCHINDYRYSADLDFSLVSGSIGDGYKVIIGALESTCIFWLIPITDSGLNRSPILEHSDH
jgi:hypothetical protein